MKFLRHNRRSLIEANKRYNEGEAWLINFCAITGAASLKRSGRKTTRRGTGAFLRHNRRSLIEAANKKTVRTAVAEFLRHNRRSLIEADDPDIDMIAMCRPISAP